MAVNDLIIFRKGTSEQWNSANPILASGEPGFDYIHNVLKIGDGTNPWLDLKPNASSDIYVYAKNTTGAALTKGQAVYINGAQGDNPTLALSIASGESTSSKTLGLLKQNLAINEFGYVVAEGILEGINTDAANAAGDTIWLSPTIPGGVVYGLANKPYAPNHMVFLGYVLRKQQNNGKVYVKVQNGYELEELHNVAISGVTNGQFLQYNTSSGLWLASSSGNFTSLQLNGTTVSTSGHNHISSNISDFNSSVSGLLPVKNIIPGTGISISSNDGSFTINSTSTGGGGGGLTEVVQDLSPQLGGDLDLNSYDIVNSGNININGNITCDYVYSDLSGTIVYANSGNFIDSLQVNGTGEINNIIADRITSNEQIIVESTGVVQSGITISKPSINISNIGDSSFATNSNIIGVQIITDSNISQNTFQYSRAFYGENKHLIASGVANSGNSVAMQFAGMRNFSSSGDAGYLNALYGIAIQYGHNILDSGVTPQTNNIYGLYVEPYNGYGTINNSYDIFARPAAYSIEDYGVINNSYGIYIQGSNKKHLLEGKLGIGTNNPSYQLDVIGSGNFSQNLFVNGTGVSISGHSHTSSNISDFNSSVSGLLPVKNIIAGSNVTVSSTSGIYTINSTASGGGGGSSSTTVRGNIIATGTLSSFNVVGGYTVGYLDLFQNGSKLLNGNDFTATDGTSVILTNSVPSGTVLEYISLEASLTTTNYTKLDSISSSFNGSSTSFGLAVSGTPYYPVSANTLGIYVGGVAQEPIVSYSVSGSNIIFTEAPVSGLTFWGVGYGTTAVATLNGIAPGSSGSPSISSSNDLTSGFYFPSSGNISVAGNLGIGTSSPSTLLDINNDKFRVRNSKTPVSTTDTGNTGDICWDSNYIYVCTNTNSWTRTPISSWSSDPYFSYVSLLLHMNGTGSSFIDSSVSPKEITAVGAATQSATQSKWGGKSLELNGSTSNLSLSSSGFTLSGDFVIETWVYLSSLATYGSIVEARSSPSYSDFICGIYNVGGTLRPDFVTAGGAGARLTGSSTSISLNTWTHVAFVRNNGVISAFVNGVRDSTQINYSSTITPASANILIGRNVDGNFINGYIDDLRITVGSSRGYTGSTITVPTAAFPDYNT